MNISHSLELELKVVVEDVVMGNTGIGYYEYGSEKKFDHGVDIVEDFQITEIYFVFDHILKGESKLKEVEVTGELFKELHDILQEDDSFREKIEHQIKTEGGCK